MDGRQTVEVLGNRTRAHRALVNVQGARGVLVEQLLTDAQARAHREENLMLDAALDQIDASEDGIAAPKSERFEIDRLGSRRWRAPPGAGSRSPFSIGCVPREHQVR